MGGAEGTTADDGVEAAEVKSDVLVARTVNVYAVPLASPVIVQVTVGAATVHVRPPGLDVTV